MIKLPISHFVLGSMLETILSESTTTCTPSSRLLKSPSLLITSNCSIVVLSIARTVTSPEDWPTWIAFPANSIDSIAKPFHVLKIIWTISKFAIDTTEAVNYSEHHAHLFFTYHFCLLSPVSLKIWTEPSTTSAVRNLSSSFFFSLKTGIFISASSVKKFLVR